LQFVYNKHSSTLYAVYQPETAYDASYLVKQSRYYKFFYYRIASWPAIAVRYTMYTDCCFIDKRKTKLRVILRASSMSYN